MGYEWPGNRRTHGDVNVFYLNDFEPLYDGQHIEELYRHLKQHEGIAVPHHSAYQPFERGKDWSYFDPELSPLVEIFSEHGSSEGCLTPYPLEQNKSMGPRLYPGSIHAGLEKGHRFGFIGSGDSHYGIPGVWGSGLMAVYAEELTRSSLWKAFHARRTYAVTGDRIKLLFTSEGALMGEEVTKDPPYHFSVDVEGSSAIDRIELVKNNRIFKAHVPSEYILRKCSPGRITFKLRLSFGWGPGEYFENQWNNWEGNIKIKKGMIREVESCFTWWDQKVERIDSSEYCWLLKSKARTYSQQLIFTIEGALDDQLLIECGGSKITLSVREALNSSQVVACKQEAQEEIERQFGLTASEIENPDVFFHNAYKMKIHRGVAENEYSIRAAFTDENKEDSSLNWYYVRVYQRNGQMAWSSPIWIDTK